MPNTKSAKKALRSSLRKRDYNLVKKSNIKNSLKDFKKALSEDIKKAPEAMSKVFSALDKAVKTNYIPKQRVARKKSRLAAALAKATKK